MEKKKLLGGRSIILPRFPLYAPVTNNKKAPDKYIKINNQLIYNSNINRFKRNNVMTHLHKYVLFNIPKNFKKIEDFPVKIHYIFYVVYNHGSIRKSRLSNEITHKPPSEDYQPNWDDDSLAFIWMKVIRDCIVKRKILPDDNVKYALGSNYDVKFVKNLNDRKIVVQLKKP